MSYTLSLGQKAPEFSLLATDGKHYSLKDFSKSKLLVIFFTCNHCPYVIGSNENTRALAKRYSEDKVQFVAINSNSENTYPEDSYPHMQQVMQKEQYPWTYLHDKDQKVALAYGALCTPHFYLFGEQRELLYTGRAVDTPRDASRSTTHELQDAIDAAMEGSKIEPQITNPIGCNIKWEGKPPKWMPPEACRLV